MFFYKLHSTYIIGILNDAILLAQAKVAEHKQLRLGILWCQPAQFTHVIFVHAENVVEVIEVLLRYLPHNVRTLQAMFLQRAKSTGFPTCQELMAALSTTTLSSFNLPKVSTITTSAMGERQMLPAQHEQQLGTIGELKS